MGCLGKFRQFIGANGKAITPDRMQIIHIHPTIAGQNNSSSSNSSASYQTEYSRWESIAERHYNSITNTGFRVRDKQGNRGGGAMQGMNSGNYDANEKIISEMHNDKCVTYAAMPKDMA